MFTISVFFFTHEQSKCPSETELDYLLRLLYNGCYGFEAMTVREMDSVVCGICGIIGELYLGDGNEKNCCSLHEVSFALYISYDISCICMNTCDQITSM